MTNAFRVSVVLLVGLPGSGKSTWLRGKNGVLSSDGLRLLLADDADNQSIHSRVFRLMRYLLKQRLELNRPVTYIDATNLTRRERRPYVRLANAFNAEIEAMLFDVPLEQCLLRNRTREGVVPDEVILQMAARLQEPALSEGFTRVSRLK